MNRAFHTALQSLADELAPCDAAAAAAMKRRLDADATQAMLDGWQEMLRTTALERLCAPETAAELAELDWPVFTADERALLRDGLRGDAAEALVGVLQQVNSYCRVQAHVPS